MKFTKILSLFVGIASFSWLTFLSLWLPHFQQPALVALKATIWFFPAFTAVSAILGNIMYYSFKYAIKVDPVQTTTPPSAAMSTPAVPIEVAHSIPATEHK